MQFGSPLNPLGPLGEEIQSYVHYIIRQGEAKRILKCASVLAPSISVRQHT